MHARVYVAVAQYDQLLPKGPATFAVGVCAVGGRAAAERSHVHVVYEACGFGFGLYRELKALGVHCYVIAPRKLDEQCTRVKTDPRDATTCASDSRATWRVTRGSWQ